MGQTRAVTVVLDAGALIALERGDARMRALCREALAGHGRLMIAAGVVGQVWRDGAKQAALAGLLGAPCCVVEPLTKEMAKAAGALCRKRGTADPIDASVVILARRENAVVVTSDPGDLRRLDPDLRIERI